MVFEWRPVIRDFTRSYQPAPLNWIDLPGQNQHIYPPAFRLNRREIFWLRRPGITAPCEPSPFKIINRFLRERCVMRREEVVSFTA